MFECVCEVFEEGGRYVGGQCGYGRGGVGEVLLEVEGVPQGVVFGACEVG